ncbi:MAG: aldo/keto reductase [Opitutales bacterium]
MNYRHLGKNGALVSPICLGTMNFGWVAEEAASFNIMDYALDQGINFFDTADVYGKWSTHAGACEELIGRWLAQGEGRRDQILLASKVYNPTDLEGQRFEPNRNGRNYSKFKIIKNCEASLRRLQTDRIDLYQLHHIDRDCPMDELWEAMDVLQSQGKIVYAGSSNFAGWDVATACMAAQAKGKQGLVTEQSVYNLDNRAIEAEMVPACRRFGVGILPWSPLGGGILAGALKKEGEQSRRDQRTEQIEKKRPQLEKYEKLCKELGEEPADIAIAWLLTNPVVTAPIVGPRTQAQLDGALHALEIELSGETMKKLDAIFPGPGEAPANYAW